MMKAGQVLGNTIKESKRTLEELLLQTPPSKMKEDEVSRGGPFEKQEVGERAAKG